MMGLEPTTFCRANGAFWLQEAAGDGTVRKPNACKPLQTEGEAHHVPGQWKRSIGIG
jgi:hypothetical protein